MAAVRAVHRARGLVFHIAFGLVCLGGSYCKRYAHRAPRLQAPFSMDTTTFTSAPLRGCITLPRAAAFVQWLTSLWRDKGVEISETAPHMTQLNLDEIGALQLRVLSSRQLECQVRPAVVPMGELLQLSLTECLGEYADEIGLPDGSWDITWEGQAPRSPAQLHILQVIGNQALSPQMRRLRLQCDDIKPFAEGGIHIRMLLPTVGVEPAWPALQEDGRLLWASGKPRMVRRTYTIRAVDVPASCIDVDVLLHADTGGPSPGSVWVEHAALGSAVGVLSPARGLPAHASRHVFVADACALPAAARQMEMLLPEQTPALLLWVANAHERSAFDLPTSRVKPEWICSGEPGASAPEIAQVLQWLERQTWNEPNTTLWIAGGLPMIQAARAWVATQPQLAGVQKMLHTYWR